MRKFVADYQPRQRSRPIERETDFPGAVRKDFGKGDHLPEDRWEFGLFLRIEPFGVEHLPLTRIA